MLESTHQKKIVNDFERRFFARPTHLATAPGRVNLIGEHIDYCDGFVMPMALKKIIAIAFRKVEGKTGRIVSGSQSDEIQELDLTASQVAGEPRWMDYVRGVIHVYREQEQQEVPGFEAMIFADLPMGAGLSSSAALELATAIMIESLVGIRKTIDKRAMLCHRAENEFVGVPCGVMDQLACANGKQDHLIFIDCRSTCTKLIPFPIQDVQVIIANSNVSHELGESQYALRRRQANAALTKLGKSSWRDVSLRDIDNTFQHQNKSVECRRARHIVSETERVIEAAAAVEVKDFERFGRLMNESHYSLRNDFEVSCSELDSLVDIALEIGTTGGVLGSRMTGGGFGGSTVTLVNCGVADSVIQTLTDSYVEQVDIKPDVFVARPGDGARCYQLQSDCET